MRTVTDREISMFEIHLINEEKAQATVEKYVRDVQAFKRWLKKEKICKENVLRYKKELVQKFAPTSVNSIISSLNSFFMFNGRYDCKIKNVKIQKQLFTNQNKELTKNEYLQLLNAAKRKKKRRLYLLMQAVCSTGIRVSELEFITYDAIFSGQAIIRCKGKMRVVILPKTLCQMLKDYAEEKNIKEGPIFISKNGNPLDRSNIWSEMKSLCKYAGISENKVFPHNFRHLFARTYYSSQKDVVRLADILGHSSVNTTRIYTMESGVVHRAQIQNLGLLEK